MILKGECWRVSQVNFKLGEVTVNACFRQALVPPPRPTAWLITNSRLIRRRPLSSFGPNSVSPTPGRSGRNVAEYTARQTPILIVCLAVETRLKIEHCSAARTPQWVEVRASSCDLRMPHGCAYVGLSAPTALFAAVHACTDGPEPRASRGKTVSRSQDAAVRN